MDRSIRGLPNPVAGPPNGERRRSVRQKLHTPVYVSFSGPRTGMVVDLSELLDLHEDGFAVQTSEPLETNRAVTLCLDLPETKSYIHGSGHVIWSDETGRGGIRFSALSEDSRRLLKEWLFANLLIGCSNHAARTEQLARRQEEELQAPPLASRTEQSPTIVEISSESTLSSLEAVRQEVLDIGDDFDAALQLITKRAVSLTGASGAALAFLTDDKMICRARAGEPAPPLGAPVDLKQGLSGECVRSGLLVSCEDTERDPRIDPEIGRSLGIGSLMAVPIVSDPRVVGLLEILSPHPRAFTGTHGTILEQLVQMIPKIDPARTQPENTQPETPTSPEAVSLTPSMEPVPTEQVLDEFDSVPAIREALKEREPEVRDQRAQPVPAETVSQQVPEQITGQDAETAPAAPSRLLYRALIGLSILAVATAAGYLVGSVMEKRASLPQALQGLSVEGAEAASVQRAADHVLAKQNLPDQRLAEQRAQPMSFPELRKLADQGDAEAEFQMGVRCHNGEDVPQSDGQAMQWFLRAADQGHVDAQSHLGAYYWAGRGVPEDLSKAYMWSEIALAGGDENSKSRLEGLASQMTRQQVLAAQQQAEEWLHTHSQRAKSEAN